MIKRGEFDGLYCHMIERGQRATNPVKGADKCSPYTLQRRSKEALEKQDRHVKLNRAWGTVASS
jgi:hypothetical protein